MSLLYFFHFITYLFLPPCLIFKKMLSYIFSLKSAFLSLLSIFSSKVVKQFIRHRFKSHILSQTKPSLITVEYHAPITHPYLVHDHRFLYLLCRPLSFFNTEEILKMLTLSVSLLETWSIDIDM